MARPVKSQQQQQQQEQKQEQIVKLLLKYMKISNPNYKPSYGASPHSDTPVLWIPSKNDSSTSS